MSTISNSGVCQEMIDLSTSIFLLTSLSVSLIIALTALPLLIWATWMLWNMKQSKLFHINFKIIVQIHLFGFMLHCTGRSLLHIIDLYNYNFKDPCDMIPNIYRCFILRLMYNSGLWITNSTAISLIIERWIATENSVTYERSSVIIGMCLAILQLIIASIPLGFLYSNTKFDGVTMFYCVTAKASTPYAPQISGFFSICAQITARIMFHYLYKRNKRMRETKTRATLSNRYQLEQNITSIRILKTFANLSSVYIIFQNACFITLLHFAANLPSYQYFAMTELNGSYPTYSIITVFVISRSITRIRRKVDNNLQLHVKAPIKTYFDNFNKQIS